jgi:tRNA(fMet)-specific endonuclease VapC
MTVLRYADHRCYSQLVRRLEAVRDQSVAVSVVTVEEQLRGWLAAINRQLDLCDQQRVYDKLVDLIEYYSEWDVVRIDSFVVAEFDRLRTQRIRIGTQDLKIAATALAHDALLLSANLRHFELVPGLRVENWLDEPSVS